MNREETRAHIGHMRLGLEARITIMNAFVQGKEIEYIPKGSAAKWSIASTPTWDWDRFDYRVKPGPRRIWVLDTPSGLHGHHHFSESAISCDASDLAAGYKCVEFVEVIK